MLGEYGPYHVGTQQVSTTDDARNSRRVGVTVWYPAVQPAGFQGPGPTIGAEPDPAGGPYPLILSSTTMAHRLAPIVVSHGFAWASVDNIDTVPATSTPRRSSSRATSSRRSISSRRARHPTCAG